MSLTSLNSFLFLVRLKYKWSRGGEEFCCHFKVKTETDTQITQEAWDVPVCWRWCQNLRFDAVQMCQHRTLSLGDLPNGAPHPALEIHQGKTQWVAGSTTSGSSGHGKTFLELSLQPSSCKQAFWRSECCTLKCLSTLCCTAAIWVSFSLVYETIDHWWCARKYHMNFTCCSGEGDEASGICFLPVLL